MFSLVAHPSMFRRLGFQMVGNGRRIEKRLGYGYGSQFNDKREIEKYLLDKDEIFVDLKYTKKYDYDVKEIIKNFNIKY